MNRKVEKTGELILVAEVMIFGIFPIISNYSTKIMPPLFFAGISTLIASFSLFIYLLAKGYLHKIKDKEALKYIIGTTIFIVIIPSAFIFNGTKLTSGINTSILLQAEILFTFLIVGVLGREKITLKKIIGSLLMLIGAISILYNGSFEVNMGEILIIIGTFFFPIGNLYAKKALELTKPSVILFLRTLIGGTMIIVMSVIFETYEFTASHYISENLLLLLFSGVVVFGLGKILWYEGLKRLDLSKAIVLGMSYPAFSMLYAYVFLGEVASYYQWLGFFVIMGGIFTITRKSKELPLEID